MKPWFIQFPWCAIEWTNFLNFPILIFLITYPPSWLMEQSNRRPRPLPMLDCGQSYHQVEYPVHHPWKEKKEKTYKCKLHWQLRSSFFPRQEQGISDVKNNNLCGAKLPSQSLFLLPLNLLSNVEGKPYRRIDIALLEIPGVDSYSSLEKFLSLQPIPRLLLRKDSPQMAVKNKKREHHKI